jgi:hypothetical protein
MMPYLVLQLQLVTACSEGNIKEVERLLAAGVDPNVQDVVGLLVTQGRCTTNIMSYWPGAWDDRPSHCCFHQGGGRLDHLHDAARRWCRCSYQKQAISKSFVIEATGLLLFLLSFQNATPLLSACNGSHPGTIQALINAGSDLEHADSNGYRCMNLAAAVKNVAAIKLLLNAGANPNRHDSLVWTQ